MNGLFTKQYFWPQISRIQVLPVLFFSPSALESFKKSHPEANIEEAICIGETTALKAKEYGMRTSIMDERSERAVVLKLLPDERS